MGSGACSPTHAVTAEPEAKQYAVSVDLTAEFAQALLARFICPPSPSHLSVYPLYP